MFSGVSGRGSVFSLLFLILIIYLLSVFYYQVDSIGIIYYYLFFAILLFIRIIVNWLDYLNYKYEIDGENFKKESGIITKRSVIIPFDRIQNVNIERGFWARMLGLSVLKIETAGKSGYDLTRGQSRYQSPAEGQLPGIDQHKAVELQSLLVKIINESNKLDIKNNEEL